MSPIPERLDLRSELCIGDVEPGEHAAGARPQAGEDFGESTVTGSAYVDHERTSSIHNIPKVAGRPDDQFDHTRVAFNDVQRRDGETGSVGGASRGDDGHGSGQSPPKATHRIALIRSVDERVVSMDHSCHVTTALLTVCWRRAILIVLMAVTIHPTFIIIA